MSSTEASATLSDHGRRSVSSEGGGDVEEVGFCEESPAPPTLAVQSSTDPHGTPVVERDVDELIEKYSSEELGSATNGSDDVEKGENGDPVVVVTSATRADPFGDNRRSPTMKRSAQYVKDRVNGSSRVGDDHPPLRCCTVPPCVALCPSVLEQNCVCEAIGRVGLVSPENARARKLLMRIGLVTQLIGMALTVVSCFAISTNFDLLSRLGFTRGTITGENISPISLSIGLRAIALDNPNPGKVGSVVISFDEFCSLTPSAETIGKYSEFQENVTLPNDGKNLMTYLDPRDCGECAAVSSGMVLSLILSVVTYFPTIFTDILRMYPNYDVNCQKTFGFVVAIFGLGMSINTWLKYNNNCVNKFFSGNVPVDETGTVIARGDEQTRPLALVLNFNWMEGPGLICLITATILKIVDIVCHFVIPTPSITRDRKEQAEYKKLSKRVG